MDPKPVLPQPEPVVPPPAPPARKFSPILILAILVLLLVVGAGGVLLGKSLNTSQPSAQPTVAPIPTQIPTPAADETANWQVYKNIKYNFEFKYPNGATFKEDDNKLAKQFSVSMKNPDFVVDVQERQANMSEHYLGINPIGMISGSIVWNILSSTGYCDAGSCGPPFIAYETINGNYRYVVLFTGSQAENSFQQQVLSTFKFLSSASSGQAGQADETINWKTYTNTQEKYLFKYPFDWILAEDVKNLQSVYLDKADKTQEKVEMPGDTFEDVSYSIHIWSRPNPNNLAAKDFYLSTFSADSKEQAEKSLKDITAAGEKGILYDEGAAPSSGPNKTVLISHKGKVFGISYGAIAHQDTHLKFLDIFNQLLTTFQFTSP